jgi:hypothetical protein
MVWLKVARLVSLKMVHLLAALKDAQMAAM